MVVRVLVLGVILSSVLSEAVHCIAGLKLKVTTDISNCGSTLQCRTRAEAILADYQACTSQVSLSTSLTPFLELLNGVLQGFEVNPAIPSKCVTSLTASSPYWSLLVTTVSGLFSSDGSLPDVFIALSLLDQWLTELVGNLERCGFSTLQNHCAELLTVSGLMKTLYVVGVNINQVAVSAR